MTRDERKEISSMHRKLIRACVPCALAILLLAALTGPLGAQDLQTQTLGRAYWHVFAAYAIAWIVVLGWIVSIARRLARIEDQLDV